MHRRDVAMLIWQACASTSTSLQCLQGAERGVGETSSSMNSRVDIYSHTYETAIWSVVHVRTDNGAGSGVFWPCLDSECAPHVVTNFHVIQDAYQKGGVVEVHFEYLDFKESYLVSIKSVAPVHDLALLTLEDWEPKSQMRRAMLGNSSALKPLEAVVLLGAPRGRQNTGSIGRVARPLSQCTFDFAKHLYLPCLQISDSSADEGNSGGVLTNSLAQVVGIPTQIDKSAKTGSFVLMALPIDLVKQTVELMLRYDKVKRGSFGVSPFSEEQVQNSIKATLLEWMTEKRGNYSHYGKLKMNYLRPLAERMHFGVPLKKVNASGPAGRAGVTMITSNITLCRTRTGDHVMLGASHENKVRNLFDDGIVADTIADDVVEVKWNFGVFTQTKPAKGKELALLPQVVLSVIGCGLGFVNGNYSSSSFRDGRYSFTHASNASLNLYFNKEAKEWRFYAADGEGGPTLFRNGVDTALPPKLGWQARLGDQKAPEVITLADQCRPKVGDRVRHAANRSWVGVLEVDDASAMPFKINGSSWPQHLGDWAFLPDIRKFHHEFAVSDFVRETIANSSGIIVACWEVDEEPRFLVRSAICGVEQSSWYSSSDLIRQETHVTNVSVPSIVSVTAINGRPLQGIQDWSRDNNLMPYHAVNVTVRRLYEMNTEDKPFQMMENHISKFPLDSVDDAVSKVFARLYREEEENFTIVLGEGSDDARPNGGKALVGGSSDNSIVSFRGDLPSQMVDVEQVRVRNTFLEVGPPNSNCRNRSSSMPARLHSTVRADVRHRELEESQRTISHANGKQREETSDSTSICAMPVKTSDDSLHEALNTSAPSQMQQSEPEQAQIAHYDVGHAVTTNCALPQSSPSAQEVEKKGNKQSRKYRVANSLKKVAKKLFLQSAPRDAVIEALRERARNKDIIANCVESEVQTALMNGWNAAQNACAQSTTSSASTSQMYVPSGATNVNQCQPTMSLVTPVPAMSLPSFNDSHW